MICLTCYQVLSGQSWLLVDGAILDVSEFSHRHPGGARLILNAVGTDVTHELLGGDSSVGRAVLSFMPHVHPEVSVAAIPFMIMLRLKVRVCLQWGSPDDRP